MKKLSQSFFYFNKTEQRGIFVILIISALLLIVPGFISSINHKSTVLPLDNEQRVIIDKKYTSVSEKPDYGKTKLKNIKGLLNKIDINSASKVQLQQLGLSNRTTNTIIKYREKGGEFKNLESLKKVYNITKSEIAALSKSLVFDIDSIAKSKFSIKPFDPNTVSKEELLSMGIRLRLVQTMINFRSKGFKFRDKNDLIKIYGITPEEIKSILPNIKFENEGIVLEPHNLKPAKYPTMKMVEINTASFEDLDALRGIGPAWANKIMKFRDALGGFYTIEQIKEIRGIDDSLARLVMSQINCDANVQKLNLNTAPYEILSKHPYISGKQAGIIINYKKQHGKLGSIKDMEKLLAFTAAELKKLEPYLEF